MRAEALRNSVGGFKHTLSTIAAVRQGCNPTNRNDIPIKQERTMGISLSTARWLAPASFVYDFAAQQYGLYEEPRSHAYRLPMAR